jgi:hypothetical protein
VIRRSPDIVNPPATTTPSRYGASTYGLPPVTPSPGTLQRVPSCTAQFSAAASPAVVKSPPACSFPPTKASAHTEARDGSPKRSKRPSVPNLPRRSVATPEVSTESAALNVPPMKTVRLRRSSARLLTIPPKSPLRSPLPKPVQLPVVVSSAANA